MKYASNGNIWVIIKILCVIKCSVYNDVKHTTYICMFCLYMLYKCKYDVYVLYICIYIYDNFPLSGWNNNLGNPSMSCFLFRIQTNTLLLIDLIIPFWPTYYIICFLNKILQDKLCYCSAVPLRNFILFCNILLVHTPSQHIYFWKTFGSYWH